MNYTITMYSDDKEISHVFECPFKLGQTVYYTYPLKRLFRKDKWVVRKSKIIEVWATNCFGVCLDDCNHIPEDWFYRIFIDKESAIEFCLKKNQREKVKIYNI
jgi:predicted lipase